MSRMKDLSKLAFAPMLRSGNAHWRIEATYASTGGVFTEIEGPCSVDETMMDYDAFREMFFEYLGREKVEYGRPYTLIATIEIKNRAVYSGTFSLKDAFQTSFMWNGK